MMSDVLEVREQLARDLHDSVCQSLYSMLLQARALELAAEQGGGDLVRQGLTRLRALAQDAHVEMRAVLCGLRPDAVRQNGLVAAVRCHAEAVSRGGGPVVRVVAPAEPLELDESTEDELFRVVREAVHNSVKHTTARTVEVRFHHLGSTLVVEVSDDGPGFADSVPSGIGLVSMRDRMRHVGGTLVIASSPTGVTVRAEVSLAA